ncbi:MAG: hypothetical protein ABI785_04675 [Gemmatimonadales bacterium]
MSATREPRARGDNERDTTRETSRRKIEMLIDEIASQSVPASDPPVWGVAASRLDQARRGALAD